MKKVVRHPSEKDTENMNAPTTMLQLPVAVAQNHTLQLFHQLEAGLIELKNRHYPVDKFKYDQVYNSGVPKKATFNALKTSVRAVASDVERQVGDQLRRQPEYKRAHQTNLVLLSEQLARFVGTESRGLGRYYELFELTAFFTNYFALPGNTRGEYYIPTPEFIELCRASLREYTVKSKKTGAVKVYHVIDQNDQLVPQTHVVTKKTGAVEKTYAGLPMKHIQSVLQPHIVHDGAGKLVKPPAEQLPALLEAMRVEKEHNRRLKELRNARDGAQTALQMRGADLAKARVLGENFVAAITVELQGYQRAYEAAVRDIAAYIEQYDLPYRVA